MSGQKFNIASPQQRALPKVDPVWQTLRGEAEREAAAEPALAGVIHAAILSNPSLEAGLAYNLAHKLANDDMSAMSLRAVFDEAFADDPRIGEAVRADLGAVLDRDPACTSYLEPFMFFKGFQALQCYRAGNWLWRMGRKTLAKYIQSRVSEVFSIDIHPAARIGRGIMMDHGHAIVIGETAVVGDECSFLHGITLGGTGKETGDRHPKVESGVLIGAGAKILGNIRVGHCSRIAAGSVVLKDVPPNSTMAGVPAKVVGFAGCAEPALSMDQQIPLEEPDYSI